MTKLLGIATCLILSSCNQEPSLDSTEINDVQPAPSIFDVNQPIDFREMISEKLPRQEFPGDWFRDVTNVSGINFQHQSGREAQHFTMIETFGSGVALLDYDLDGDLDIYCVGGGLISEDMEVSGVPGRLYQNQGAFQFEDVTENSGLMTDIHYSHGVAVGDVNSDDYPDLFITCYGQSHLFLNNKDGTFRDDTEESGLTLDGWHTAAAFADLNRDGFLDLYVAGYLQWEPNRDEMCIDPNSGLRDVCMPGNFLDAPDHLFYGMGDGRFIQVDSTQIGLRDDGKGLGVVIADFDNNQVLDLYVANDVVRNHLYLGQTDGTWLDAAVASGVIGNEFGAPEGSMGVHAADIDRDGWLDLVVTNYEFEENDLYHNEGEGLFAHMTVPLGLAGPCKPYVGFGTLLADFDMDGWDDLVIVNGHVTYRNRKYSYQQPAFLYQNQQGKRFSNVTDSAGPWFSVPHAGRGIAVGDLDNNGALDLVVTEQDGPTSILQNLHQPDQWIGIQLQGDRDAVDLTGSKVNLIDAGSKLEKTVISGGSYLSHSDQRLVFSLSTSQKDKVNISVTWPDGQQEHFAALTLGQYHILKKGTGSRINKQVSSGK